MSVQLFLADKLLRVMMKRRFSRRPDVMTLRELMGETRPARAPAEVRIDTLRLGEVPAERLTTPRVSGEGRALLYIHGGGFVGGSPKTHRPLTWRLAEETAAPVYAIDYRLAPEHPFPAALEDCTAAYRAILEAGTAPGSVSVGGDSAGGNLTLALALNIKRLGLPQPASLFCISPVTDLAGETPSRVQNRRTDAMFDWRTFPSVRQRYCPSADPEDPLISPLRGDVRGLPPTLILCSATEMLRDDGTLMAERLKKAGVVTALEVWPKVFHAWPIAADFLPESRAAIKSIGTFIARHWQAATVRAA